MSHYATRICQREICWTTIFCSNVKIRTITSVKNICATLDIKMINCTLLSNTIAYFAIFIQFQNNFSNAILSSGPYQMHRHMRHLTNANPNQHSANGR